jgi:predicted dehydrogenase
VPHPLRAAIVGTGFAGVQHADALRRIGVAIGAVVGSQPDRAEAAAARMGVERGTADLESVIADDTIDVLHVCVPNALHAPIVRAAIAAGKHVVCEKPLATSLEDALDLAARARAASTVSVLCHNYRFYPMAAEMRAQVASGVVGRPHLVRGAYLQDWLLDRGATSWRIDPTEGGPSRAVADIGTHWVDLAETVLDRRVESVMASVATVHARRPDWHHVASFQRGRDGTEVDVRTEDEAVVLLRFDGDLLGTATVSQVAAGHQNDLVVAIDGEAGSLEWSQERPDELRRGSADGGVALIARDRPTLSRAAAGLARLPRGHGEGWADALRNLLEAAYTAACGMPAASDDPPLPTFDDGARHVAFVEAVLRSNAEGRWIAIRDIVGSMPSTQVRS